MNSLHAQLREQGYAHIPGALRQSSLVVEYKQAFQRFLTELLAIYVQRTAYVLPQAVSAYSLPECLAILMGLSGGQIFDHLAPALTIKFDDYRWSPDLPLAQLPEIFALMRAPELLNVLSSVLGDEIYLSAEYLMNLKLPAAALRLTHQIAEELERPLLRGWRYHFRVRETPWHRDVTAYSKDSHESQILTVWIPLNEATETNGCLQVIPGSHWLDSDDLAGNPEQLQKAVALPAQVGDVVIFDRRLHHSSVPNTSESDFRWSLNFRYHPTGQSTNVPFLPGFVVRSSKAPETVLKDAELWQAMWRQALNYHAGQEGAPALHEIKAMIKAEAQALAQEWQQRVPNDRAWLQLASL